jgi:hypothetical protein
MGHTRGTTGKFKYQDGQYIGRHGMRLLKRTRTDKHRRWHGWFKCRCGTIKELDISKVAVGMTTSCGCRQRAARKESGRKNIAKLQKANRDRAILRECLFG